jgi:hypothetical protein
MVLDSQQLQIVAQLVDNLEKALSKLEEAYADNNSEEFNKAKQNILDFQKKIAQSIT